MQMAHPASTGFAGRPLCHLDLCVCGCLNFIPLADRKTGFTYRTGLTVQLLLLQLLYGEYMVVCLMIG